MKSVVPSRSERRASRSGAGAVHGDEELIAHPEARDWFALLGEVLLVGVLVSFASIPLVTGPAALAAGVSHLRRYVRAEGAPLRRAWNDFVRALPGGLIVGAVTVVVTLVLVVDMWLALRSGVPGGAIVTATSLLGLAAVSVTLFASIGLWTPDLGWRGAVRAVPASVRSDVPGALYLLSAAVFAVVVTYQLVPLVVPAAGCVALAIVAVPVRRTRRRG